MQREFKYSLPEALLESKDKETISTFIEKLITENTLFVSNGFKKFVSPEEMVFKFNEWKLKEEAQKKVQFEIELSNKKLASKIVGEEFVNVLVAAVPLSKEEQSDAKIITQKYNNFVKQNPSLQKREVHKNIEELTQEVRNSIEEEPIKKDYDFMQNESKG